MDSPFQFLYQVFSAIIRTHIVHIIHLQTLPVSGPEQRIQPTEEQNQTN